VKQLPLWLNPGRPLRFNPGWWRAAPARRPGEPDRNAERRWQNEGGNPPLTEPPDANSRKHL